VRGFPWLVRTYIEKPSFTDLAGVTLIKGLILELSVRKIFFLIIASTLFLVAAFLIPPNESPLSEKEQVVQMLTNKLRSFDQKDEAYLKTYAQLMEVTGKKPRRPTTQHPGELIQAFRDIKNGQGGQTYSASYRQKELKKAVVSRKTRAKTLDWVERGPNNVSGRTRAMLVDPDHPGTWFAATVGGGVWKTVNSGQTWENNTPELSTLSTTCIAMAPSNHNVLYVGTGMGYGRTVDLAGSGVWKSVDRGENWFQLASTANGELLPGINRIYVNPLDENIVLVCSNGDFTLLGPNGGERPSGIFRSEDGGDSWTQVFDPEPIFTSATDNRVQQLIGDPNDPNKVYASVNEVGVIKSNDGGKTWSVSASNFALASDIGNPPDGAASYQGISVRTELAMAPSDPNRIYAAVERPHGIADLYMTRDGGTNWRLVHDTGNDPNWFNSTGISGAFSYTAGWFDNTIMVNPFDPDEVYLGGVRLWQANINSTSYLRSTFRIGNGVHADQHDLKPIYDASVSSGFRILNGNDGGYSLSADGPNSFTQKTGIRSTQFYGIDKRPGENQYIGGMQDNNTFISPLDPDHLSNWRRTTGGDGFETAWNFANPDLVMGCSQRGNLYRSTDGGLQWSNVTAITGDAPFITKIANSKQDPDLLFSVSDDGIFRSDDFGATWSLEQIEEGWLGYRSFDNVEISLSDPRVVWISSKMEVDAHTNQRGGIHVSSDGGLSFEEVSDNLPAELVEASGIGFDPIDPDIAYLLFSAAGIPKVMRTKDRGKTFEDLSRFTDGVSQNGFPDVAVYDILVMPYDKNILWVATEIGLFQSLDDGATWEIADNGLPPVGIFQMRLIDGQIILATYGRGIWTLDLSELQGYQPPQVTLTPRHRQLAFQPTGNLAFSLDLRSEYDTTEINLTGVGTLSPKDTGPSTSKLLLPVDAEQTIEVDIEAIRNGESYRSSKGSKQVYAVDPRRSYQTNFNDASDWSLNGMIQTSQGFNSTAIQSPHFYSDDAEYSFMLKHPILVPEENATLSYRDIAIVEPGNSGSEYGDNAFWDYVVVEGTSDGITWKALSPGYDARFNSAWLNAYNTQTTPTQNMFVQHQINLLDTFAAGDQIFVRFRMFSDIVISAWGWVVDDITIGPGHQQGSLDVLRTLVYPWLSLNDGFESVLIVNNLAQQAADVRFTAKRSQGFGERTKVYSVPANGFLKIKTSRLFPQMGEGSGFSVVMESNSDQVYGRWVTLNLTTSTGASPSQGVASPIESDGARDLIFGYLPITDGFQSAPVIVNMGASETTLNLSLTDAEGNTRMLDPVVLGGGDLPLAELVSDWVETRDRDYYLTVHSDPEPISGMGFVFNEGGEASLGNASVFDTDMASNKLLYPWVSNNTDFGSTIIVNNTSQTTQTVTLTALREDGSASSRQKVIAAGGFLRENASSLFADLGSGKGYSVVVEGEHGGLYGRWVTYSLVTQTGQSPSQGVATALDVEEGTNDLLYGFMPVTEGLISALVVVNNGDQSADVSLEFFNQAGILVHTDTSLSALEPMKPYTLIVSAIAELEEDVYVKATASSSSISGVAFIFNDEGEPAIGNATPIK